MIRRQAIAVLALIGLFVALYLALHKFGLVPQLACTLSSCERVQASRWSIFMGVPVAVWGVGYYALVFVLAVLGTTERYGQSRYLTKSLAVLTGWGVLFSTWLTSLEAFEIKGWCQYCVVSAVIAVLLCILAVLDLLRPIPSELASDEPPPPPDDA